MHNFLMWVDKNIHMIFHIVHTCERTCKIDRRLSFVIFTRSKISHNLFTAFFTWLNISHYLHTYFTWLTPVVNHGQKSWETFAFLGRFPMHTGPTPSPHRTNNIWRVYPEFFRVSTFYRVGGGRTARKFRKGCTVRFKREPRNDRKIWILQYCRKDFCPGL